MINSQNIIFNYFSTLFDWVKGSTGGNEMPCINDLAMLTIR